MSKTFVSLVLHIEGRKDGASKYFKDICVSFDDLDKQAKRRTNKLREEGYKYIDAFYSYDSHGENGRRYLLF